MPDGDHKEYQRQLKHKGDLGQHAKELSLFDRKTNVANR